MLPNPLPELNLDNRELEWARLRYWWDKQFKEFQDPPEGDPESFNYKRIVRVRANLEALKALDKDLNEAGIPIPFAALHGCKVPYPEAIPVLLRHLALPYNDDNKESILRKLAVPYAGEPAFREIHRLLLAEKSTGDTLLFAYGIALEAVATKGQVRELLSIAWTPCVWGGPDVGSHSTSKVEISGSGRNRPRRSSMIRSANGRRLSALGC